MDATCGNSNGSVTISWGGGVGPYDITGDLTLANASSPQQFTNLSSGTYNVVVTDANGCTDTASATIGDTAGPSANASAVDANCGNADGSVTITWTGGVGPFDISGDLNQTNANSPEQFTGLTSGTYNVTVTDNNGCTDTASVTVGDLAGPVPNASAVDANCGNADGSVTITWSGGTGPYDITGDLTQLNATSPQLFPNLSSGTYTVTVTDANDCSDTASVMVGDSPGVTANGTATNTTCGNSDGSVTISWSGGTGPYDITGDLTQANSSSPQQFTGLTSGTYTVTVTDVNGCTDTASATVGNANGPTASASSTDETCDNLNGTATISWSGGTGPYDISGDLSQTNAISPQVFNGLGSGTYNVIVSDVNGCTSIASTTIINIDGPSVSAIPTNATCENSNGEVTITWTDGVGPFDITGDLTQANASTPQVFSGLGVGSYTVTVTDANGCTDSATANVTNIGGPTVSSSGVDATCGASNGRVTIIWGGGTGPFDITGDLTLANASSPQSFMGLGSGTYNVTVTDDNGCTDTASVTIGDTSGPMADGSAMDANCGNADGSVTITWTGGVGPFDISGDLNQVNASSPEQFNGLTSGTYTVTVTDDNGCTDTASITINDLAGPDATAVATDANCGNIDGSVTISWTGGVGPFDITGDLNQANASSPQAFNMLAAGNYAVTVTDANGCTSTASAVVGDSPSLSANGTATNTTCGNSDGSVTVSWSGGTAPFDISGDLTMIGASSPQVFSNLSGGSYTVIVTDANGCTDSATATVGNANGPTASTNSTDESCGNSDGTVTVSWNGGTGPYDITGDLTQANATSPFVFDMLNANSYSVTVTDANGCSSVASATINNIAGPVGAISSMDASCGLANGSLNVTWSGGTGPYDITGDLTQLNASSPSNFIDLNDGVYNLVITDSNGCSGTVFTTINNSTSPELTTSSIDSNCGSSDGSVTLTWTDGVGPFDITGDLSLNGATSPQLFSGLASGTYNVTITDGSGCTDMASIMVNDLAGPVAMSSMTEANCGNADGTISITWNGGVGPFDIIGDLNMNGATSPHQFTSLMAGAYTMTLVDANNCSTEVMVTVGDVAGPSSNIAGTNTSCGNNDGTINFSWSGGTAPFDVSGDLNLLNATSPVNFSDLMAGDYILIVTDDNGCSSSDMITIDPSSGLTANGSSTNTSCGSSDGQVTIEWNGGTGPYDITGDLAQTGASSPQVFSNLSSGTYTVTVTDVDGCTNTASATVGNTNGPTATIMQVDESCSQSNGSIVITWNGGTGPYDITGDLAQVNATSPFTFDNLAAGSYAMTVTDANGCSSVASANLTNVAAATLNLMSSEASCGNSDGTVTVTWNGGTGPFDISGDLSQLGASSPQVFSNLAPGIYNVILTDANNCVVSDMITVGSSNGPAASGTATDASCGISDGTATIEWNGGTGPYNISGDLTFMNASSPQQFTALASGMYDIVVTDSNGCTSPVSVTVGNSNGPTTMINSTDENCGLADGSLSITWTGGLAPFDISGDLSQLNATSPSVFNNLTNGTYNLIVTDANGCSSTATATINDISDMTISLTGMDGSCNQMNAGVTVNWTGGTGPFDITGDLNQMNATSPFVFSDLDAGNYNVVLTDVNGCMISESVQVTVGPAVTVSCAELTQETGPGNNDGSGSVDILTGTGPFTLSWDGPGTNDGTQNGLALGQYDILNLTEGTYDIDIIDDNGMYD